MKYMSTGEVATLLGVSKRTLQNWLRHKKIAVPEKAANGYYCWSSADVLAAQEYKVKLQNSTYYHIGGKKA